MPLKILYAANNYHDSKVRLWRFLQNIDENKYDIKIAAYRKSSPPINIDWTLDSLLDIYYPNTLSFDNDHLRIYYDQVKSFNPDLIISDLEPFTSHIAIILNKKLWQVSPMLLSYGLSYADKYRLGLRKKYSYFFRHTLSASKYLTNIIDNSNRKFIYSHFIDTINPPNVKEDFEWIRPYHLLGNISKPCHHAITGALLSPDKNIYHLLNKYNDSVIFTPFVNEVYKNLIIKDLENELEYICNIKNSDVVLNQGHSSVMADAFYNSKYSLVVPDFRDIECITNAMMSEKLDTSQVLLNIKLPEAVIIKDINLDRKNSIKFLHEKIEEL